MRVSSGKPMSNGGYWHPSGTPKQHISHIKYEAPKPSINATAMIRDWQSKTKDSDISQFAQKLGVHFQSLKLIGAAWSEQHRAWAFPMKDGYGAIIGIRLRDNSGRKWAVTGSKAGLFFVERPAGGDVCICEGPTDTAAGLTIGLNAIGRPSCAGNEDTVLTCVRHAKRVLIISDNDGPGWDGTLRLQSRISKPTLVWTPPCKDIREFVRLGGTKDLIHSLTKNLVWSQGINKSNTQ